MGLMISAFGKATNANQMSVMDIQFSKIVMPNPNVSGRQAVLNVKQIHVQLTKLVLLVGMKICVNGLVIRA